MDNFDLKKYLAEGKLLKEEVMVNPIIMFGGKDYIKGIIAEPDNYGHFPEDAEWIKSNILTAPKMMSIQDYMNLDGEWVKQAQIETGQGSDLDHIVDALNVHVEQGLITPEQEKEAMKVVGLAEGKLLKEELTWYVENENEDVRFQNDEYLEEVGRKIKEIHPDISDEDLNKIIIMTGEQYSREEDFHGDNITSGNFVNAAVEIYQTDVLN